jgi:hypothetical protein
MIVLSASWAQPEDRTQSKHIIMKEKGFLMDFASAFYGM